MTDFDFEILEVINSYNDKGVTLDELQNNHFKNYHLLYNLFELSNGRAMDINGVKISYVNANVLRVENEYLDEYKMFYTPRYFITDRGKSLLSNWERQRKQARRMHIIESIGWALLGATFGTILGQISTKFLSCP